MKMTLEKREADGSRKARSLRRQGRLPGIAYGHGLEPTPVSLDLAVFDRVHRSGEHTIEGVLGGEESIFLIQDLQFNSIGDHLLHVDLRKVSREERVHVKVAIEGFGHPTAGVLEHQKVDVLVECFAYQIPDKVTVILTHMKIGDVIRVKDLQFPEGVKILDGPELPVYALSAVYVVEEAPAAPVEGAPAEPERIGGRPEEAQEAGAAEKEKKVEKEKKA